MTEYTRVISRVNVTAPPALPAHFARMTVDGGVYQLSQKTVWTPDVNICVAPFGGDYGWYGAVFCPELGAYGRWIGGVGGHGFSGNGRNGYNADSGEIEIWEPNQYETADAAGAEIYLDKPAADALPEYRRFDFGPGGDRSARATGSWIVRTLAGNRLEVCSASGWVGENPWGWREEWRGSGSTQEGVSVFLFGQEIPAPLAAGTRYYARDWAQEANGNASCALYTSKSGGSPVVITGSLDIGAPAGGGYWGRLTCYMRGWDEQFPVSIYCNTGWIVPRPIASLIGMMRADMPQGVYRYSYQTYVPSGDSSFGEPLVLGINPWSGWFVAYSELGPMGGLLRADARWPSGSGKNCFFYERLHTRTYGRLRSNNGASILHVPEGAPGALNGGGGGTAAWMPGARKGYGFNGGSWGCDQVLVVDISAGENNATAQILPVGNGSGVLSEQGVRAIASATLGRLIVGMLNDNQTLALLDTEESPLRWRRITLPFGGLAAGWIPVWASTLGASGALLLVALTSTPVVRVVTLAANWRTYDGGVMPLAWVRDVPVTLQDGITDCSIPGGEGVSYGAIDWIPAAGVLSWLGGHAYGTAEPQHGIRVV